MTAASQALFPIRRLMWKEYRVQKSLWLTLLISGAVPQLLLRLIATNRELRMAGVWAIAVIAPLMFMVGSTAVLFAGEREERTCDWLLNMAVPARWTLLSKWGFLLTATLAMALTLSLSALSLLWAFPFPPGQLLAGGAHDSIQTVQAVVAVAVVCLVWGNLASLLSRRVIAAVPAMGFWWIFTIPLPLIGLSRLFGNAMMPRVQTVVTITMSCMIGLLNVWLGWRWCHGRYLDGSSVISGVSKIWSRWDRPRGISTSRLPEHVGWIRNWCRDWQRLIWQERHRDHYYKLIACSVCFLGILASLAGQMAGDYQPELLFLIMLAIPLLLGILGFRYDGEGQSLHFLANRGVNLRHLLLAKHIVWLPRATWILSLIWFVALSAECLIHPKAAANGVVFKLTTALQDRRDVAIYLVLMAYGIGQFVAVLFRSSVLVLVVGVTCSIASGAWMALMFELQVPLWWSMGVMIAFLFGWTFLLAPRWHLERRFTRRDFWLVPLFVAPPVIVFMGVIHWRLCEFAGFGPSSPTLFAVMHPLDYIQLRGQALARIDAVKELRVEIVRQQSPLSAVDLEALGVLRLGDRIAPPAQTPEPRLTSEAFWNQYKNQLDQVMAVLTRDQYVPPHRHLDKFSEQIPFFALIKDAARLSIEEGRLEEGLRYHCAALRLTSCWAAQSTTYHREQSCFRQGQTLHDIIEWSNHPSQTPDLLRGAIKSIRVELDLFPSWRETFVAEYLADLNSLNTQVGTPRKASGARAFHPLNMHKIVLDYSPYFRWEWERTRRLRERQLVALDDGLRFFMEYEAELETERRLQLSDRTSYRRSEVAEAQIDSSTPLFYANVLREEQSFLYNGIRYFQQKQIEHDVEKRITVLALLLRIHKLEHGSWPNTLADLLGRETIVDVPPLMMIDPWSGEPLQYYGNRFDPAVPRQLLLRTGHSAKQRDVPGVTYRKSHRRLYWRSGMSVDPRPDDGAELWVDRGMLVIKPARVFLAGRS